MTCLFGCGGATCSGAVATLRYDLSFCQLVAGWNEEFWIEICEIVAYDPQTERVRTWLFAPDGYGTSYLKRQGAHTWEGDSEYLDFAGRLRSTSKLKLTRVNLDKFLFERTRTWKTNGHTHTESYTSVRKKGNEP